jgi:hypothetical protein
MLITDILAGITKYKKEIDTLSTRINVNRVLLYLDCIYARFKYGCMINHYIHGHFYKLRRYERKKHFTYRHWKRIIPKVNDLDFVYILKNKVDFNVYFSDYIKRDWLYSKDMSIEQFKHFITKHGCAIVKPQSGLEGGGIKFVQFSAMDNIDYIYTKLKNDDVLIEEKICQHPDMIFGNKSVNTIRVYTLYNEFKNEVYILKTVVRVGIGNSIVDNSHSGGCAYEIDIMTGHIISTSFCYKTGIISHIHPGTDICMLGRKIPYWDDVLNMCISAAKKITKCRLIGWDVAITENGPLLIEGNHEPDLCLIEFVGNHGYKNIIREHLNI